MQGDRRGAQGMAATPHGAFAEAFVECFLKFSKERRLLVGHVLCVSAL